MVQTQSSHGLSQGRKGSRSTQSGLAGNHAVHYGKLQNPLLHPGSLGLREVNKTRQAYKAAIPWAAQPPGLLLSAKHFSLGKLTGWPRLEVKWCL